MNDDVKRLYQIGYARWYDPFKSFWNWIVASRAEDYLAVILTANLDEGKTVLDWAVARRPISKRYIP